MRILVALILCLTAGISDAYGQVEVAKGIPAEEARRDIRQGVNEIIELIDSGQILGDVSNEERATRVRQMRQVQLAVRGADRDELTGLYAVFGKAVTLRQGDYGILPPGARVLYRDKDGSTWLIFPGEVMVSARLNGMYASGDSPNQERTPFIVSHTRQSGHRDYWVLIPIMVE